MAIVVRARNTIESPKALPDPLTAFFEQRLDRVAGAVTPKEAVRAAQATWAAEQRLPPADEGRLGAALIRWGGGAIVEKRPRIEERRVPVYSGVRLRSDGEEP
jgi:hypothetical protein